MPPSPQHIVMLLSNGYGPDPRVQKEAGSLIRTGYKVTLICWDRQGKHPQEEIIDGLHIIRVAVRSTYGRGSSQLTRIPQFWIAALRRLSGLRPDVVHCHDLDTVPIGYLYAARRGIPWIFDAHECYPEQMKAQVHPIIYRRLLALEKFAARRATLTITVGELLAQRFDEMGARVVLVGNYQPLFPPDTPAVSRQDIDLHEDEYLVAYIGGFLPRRAIQALVQAVDFAPDIRILLAGDGATKDEILALCRTRPQVIYAGWVPLSSVPAYIQLADVVYYGLLPGDVNNEYSRPNALFYAMAAGKPLLTSRVGEIAHIVQQEQCGLVIDEASPQLIAAGLERLRDPEYRRTLGRNGRKAAQDRYNWENAEKVLLEAYRSLLGS